MPIYEYICEKCNKKFEIIQKITEKPKGSCPKCKGKLEKIISQSSFHLKGSGWFKPTSDSKASKDTSKKNESTKSSENCGSSPCGSENPKGSCATG